MANKLMPPSIPNERCAVTETIYSYHDATSNTEPQKTTEISLNYRTIYSYTDARRKTC